ncbi:MAG: hypothetical protein DMG65_24680 [Candidatus Angelobacter sp. Gp1-AA117]|nr:MAG: hypothetical protein DMG65_24680 [Candidatus Angelobacter sp. Gp1-AA117]
MLSSEKFKFIFDFEPPKWRDVLTDVMRTGLF